MPFKANHLISFFQGLTRNLILAILSCVIGSSFQFGYNTGVVNAPELVSDFITRFAGFMQSLTSFLKCKAYKIFLQNKFGEKILKCLNSRFVAEPNLIVISYK